MENHHFLWVNPLFLWPFSMAMLIYQRVVLYRFMMNDSCHFPCQTADCRYATNAQCWWWCAVISLARKHLGQCPTMTEWQSIMPRLTHTPVWALLCNANEQVGLATRYDSAGGVALQKGWKPHRGPKQRHGIYMDSTIRSHFLVMFQCYLQ